MKILEKIHWRLALWFALKLFFTPLKFPIPKREMPMRKKAIKHCLTTNGSPFTCFEWGEEGPAVLLMHGWSGRATQFFQLAEVLVEEGYHVFSVEAPAHGNSDQKKTSMIEFVDAIKVVSENFGPFRFAIGHSLGGMAIFNALESRQFKPEKVVIIGTPANIPNVVHDFAEKVGASPKVAEGIIGHIQKSYSLKVEEVSTDHLAKWYNPPGLIIHDENDHDVSAENARQTSKHWSAAELIITEGLGHRKILMDQTVMERIVQFFAED